MVYSEKFKSKMVEKLLRPSGPSARALSKEVGVPHVTLSQWRRQALSFSGMEKNRDEKQVKPHERRPQDWTPEERLRVVLESSGLKHPELGEFLRREGLHKVQLESWRELALAGVSDTPRRVRKSPEHKRIQELEKELTRKDRALAETAALLVLKKKVQAIWGDEDDDMILRSGK